MSKAGSRQTQVVSAVNAARRPASDVKGLQRRPYRSLHRLGSISRRKRPSLPLPCADGSVESRATMAIDTAVRCSVFLMVETAKTPNEYKQASEKLYFACQVHRPRACTKLADMLLLGQFGKTSPARARILLDGACRRGHEPACERLRTHEGLNDETSKTKPTHP